MAGKDEVARIMAEKLGIPHSEAHRNLKAALGAIQQAAVTETVILRGFGRFQTAHRKSRPVCSPLTKERGYSKARDVLTFRAYFRR